MIWVRALRLPPGDTRVIGYCAVFKVREEATRHAPTRDLVRRATGGGPVSQNSTACEAHHDELEARACALPGPVDIL